MIPPAPTAPVAPALPSVDLAATFAKVATGNWVGMLKIAAATLGTSLVLGLVAAVLLADDRGKVGSLIGSGLSLGLDALGVPLIQKNDDSDYRYKVSTFSPALLITLVTLLVGIVVFRRVTAGYPNRVTALADAARAAVVMIGLTTVLTIVLVISNPTVTAFDGAFLSDDSRIAGTSFVGGDFHVRPHVAGAIFLPAVVLLVVLALSVLAQRRTAEQGALQKIHDKVAPALAALTTLVLATVPAGLVLALAEATSDNATNSLEAWVSRLLYLPSLGIATLGVGLGAPFGVRTGGTESLGRDEYLERVSGLAQELNGLVWFAIPVALAAAVLAAHQVTRRSERETALWNGGVYLATLLAALPLLAVFSRHSVTVRGGGEEGHFRVGVDGTPLTFIFLGVSAVALIGLLIVSGKLDVSHLQTQPGQAAAPQHPEQHPAQHPEQHPEQYPPQQYPPQGPPQQQYPPQGPPSA